MVRAKGESMQHFSSSNHLQILAKEISDSGQVLWAMVKPGGCVTGFDEQINLVGADIEIIHSKTVLLKQLIRMG